MTRRWIDLVAALATIGINFLANLLPLNGLNTGQISDRFAILFVPAGYVFSIWGVIYIGWLALTIYQLSPAGRANPRTEKVGWLFVLSCVFNSAWLFAWHYEVFALTVPLLLALAATLAVLYVRLEIGRVAVGAAEFWCLQAPVSLYLGWASVASIANVSQFLYFINWDGFGLDPELWALIMLVIGAALAFYIALTRRDRVLPLVFVWAFVGIAVKQSGAALVGGGALLMALVALLGAALASLPKRRAARAG